MSERARNSREIRIVPGTLSQPAGGKRPAALCSVQIFRSLTAQTSALAGADALVAPTQPDEAHAPQTDAGDPANLAEITLPHDAMPATPGHSEPSAHRDAAEHDDRDTTATPRHAAGTAPKRVERNNLHSEDAALGKHIVHACATAAHGEVLAHQLADRIARFCSMSGATDDASWEVTLPMNPTVLSDTLLHLHLSPSRIAIRFETSNSHSARLIYDNADTLRTRLADALRRQIDVEVVV
jgi:hypothetical protein